MAPRATKRKAAAEAPAPTAKKAKKVVTTTTSISTTPKRKRGDEPPAPASKKAKIINEAPSQKLDVYVMGEGGSSELGLGTAKLAKNVKRPRLNDLLAKSTVGVVKLICGGMHVIALTHDNKILTWGVNDQGALGRDTTWSGGTRDVEEDSDSENEGDDNGLNPLESTPGEVDWSTTALPEGIKFTDVAAGDSCTFVVTDTGLVYGWGTFRDNKGIFGFTKAGDEVTRPVLIPGLKDVVSVTCQSNAAFAVTKTGATFSWGSGEADQLGHRVIEWSRNKHARSLIPRPFGLPHGPKTGVVSIHAGADHALAICKNGDVWAWGSNNYGQTGIPEGVGSDHATVVPPRKAKALSGKGIISIGAGRHHSIAATNSGECLAWGRVDSHQIGIDKPKLNKLPEEEIMRSEYGQLRVVMVPQKVNIDGDVVMVAAGTDQSFAVTEQGQAYSWGFNENFQTGHGGEDDDIAEAKLLNSKAVLGKKIVEAGCGGQFSVLLGV